MNFINFFIDSIRAANRLKRQDHRAALDTAQRLIDNYCYGGSPGRMQPSVRADANDTHEASVKPERETAKTAKAGQRPDDDALLPTDIIEQLAVANSKSPRRRKEPTLDMQPKLSSRGRAPNSSWNRKA